MKHYIFELEHVIVSSEISKILAIQQTFRDYGYPTPTNSVIEHYSHISVRKMLNYLTKAYSFSQIFFELFLNSFYFHLNKIETDYFTLVPGIEHILYELDKKGIELYVISNKNSSSLVTILERLEIREMFKTIYGDNFFASKNNDVKLQYLLKFNNLKPEECLLITNTFLGVESGKKNKIETCSILWGSLDVDKLAINSPDIVLSQIQMLLDLI